MRRLLRYLLIGMVALAASGEALAQSVTVLDYNFGTTSTPVLTPTTRHNNVVAGDPLMLIGNQMTSVPKFNTGGNTTGFMEYNNWPTSESGAGSWASSTRNSLLPSLVAPTVWTRFTMGPNSSFSLANATLQFRYQRPSATSPKDVKACLTWFDGTTYRRRYSATTNLSTTTSTTAWQTAFNVRIGGTGSAGDTLPTGTAMSGKTFLLELHFYNCTSASNKINVDDVKFLADSAVTGSTAWLTPASLPGGNVGVPYFQRMQAGSGNVASHTYSLVSGSLPAGLSLSSGHIVGLPTTAGTSTFTLRATGSANTDRAFTLVIGAAPTAAPGATLASWNYDGESADTLTGPNTMSSCLSEVTWGFDEKGTLSNSIHAEGTAAASGNPISATRTSSGSMRCFTGWEVGDNYTATRNSLLHITDPSSSSGNWRFAVSPTANTGSIPPTAYSTTGESNVLQYSMTFRQTATGTLRSFKADLLRWLKDNMTADGDAGARYVRLYAYYTNDAGVVQRWTGNTIDINAIYYQAMQSANQNQFRTFWWDLSTLHNAINATTAKYANRKIAFELYFYHEHGYDAYQIPVVLIDNVGIQGDFTCPTLSIGNLVWDDLDNDGIKDTGESGLAGAQVELFRPGADNAIGGTGGNADTKVGSTITTTATGAYSFTGLDPGNYYVRVTPPSTHTLTGGVADTVDNADDNDNNGAQPGGRGTPLFSPIINLAVDAESITDGDTDNDTNYTVDFGVYRGLCVGNLVFIDVDDNGSFNSGDTGAGGVAVQLYNTSNTLVASTTTSNGTLTTGFQVQEVFSSTSVRNYTQAMAAINGTNQTASWKGSATQINYLYPGDAEGRFSSGNVNFPNDINPYSPGDFVVRATGTITIPTTGTYTFGMTLDDGGRLRVNNTDVIVDEAGLHSMADRFGQITLNAGTYPIEMVYFGVWGGGVELYAQSGSHSAWNTGFKLVGNTASGGLAVNYNDPTSGGRWQIDGLAPGSYYVKIPASEFLTGKPLFGLKSIKNGTPAWSVIDDDGAATGSDNGTDTPTPAASGVRTTSFQLATGTEPTNGTGETGTGGTSDDTRDTDVDLTVDLGFHTEQEGCFYIRIIDTDRDGVPLIQRLNGTTLSTNLVFGGSICNIDRAQFAYDTRTQRLDIQYIFNQWSGKKVEGFYFVLTDGPTPNYDNTAAIMYVDVFNRASPKVTVMKYQGPEGGQTSYLTPGQLLDSSIARPGFCAISAVELGAQLSVTISADMSRVNNGNLWTSYGINPATWGGMSIGRYMGIWSHYYDLASAPTYNAEGKLTSWPRNNPDSSWWNYMDSYNSEALPTESPCGAIMTIGNIVFNDANLDGNFDAGEGVDNVLMYLFPEGRNALTDTPAAAVLTTGGGQYAFTGLSAGRYFVHIPPSEFQNGGPLFGRVSIAGAGGDAVADDQVDENGIDAAFPAATGISSGIIVLADNTEPIDTGVELGGNKTTDNADDNNGDLTVDFGFRAGANLTLGDLVWFDSNDNGTKQGGESGIPNIPVDLFTPGADNAIGGSGSNADTLVASTTTNGSGTYSFAIPSPGRYFVRITPSSDYPATGSNVTTTDNGNDGDNNGAQPGGEYSFIYSPVITLTANGEPGSSGSTNTENTIDFGLTRSRKLSVGNLVYLDNNNNGRYDTGDGGVGGVRVQLFNNSNVLLQETTTVKPPFLPGWSLKQAQASIEVKSVATAEAVMLGTSRTSLWTGTTDFINYVTTSWNNDWSDWGNAGDGKLLPNGSMENMVLQATATMNITTGDTYTFCINTDDGGRLKVDGSLLIHDDGLHGPEDRFGSVVLPAGPHTIEFLGFEWVGGGGFEVWAKRGQQDWFDDGFRLIGDTANGGIPVTYPGTASDTGRYRFNNIDPGTYYVKIPNTEFSGGGPLEGRLSFVQATAPTDDQKDDNSTTGSADSGVDAAKPAVTGISSHTFALSAGGEPTGTAEGGFMGSEDDAADNNGDMTIDFALDGTKQVVTGCYRFNMKDLNKDCNFSAVEEISPDQPYDFGYSNGQNGVFFYFTDWDMIFDADKDRLSIDVTYEQVNGKKVDNFWICVTPGPAPHTDNSAIIYFDGTNRASPKITVYKYTTSLGESSWQTTGNCMIATAGTGINASDVISMSVVETGVSVRFKATINTARINNANNWSFVTNKSSWVGSKFYSRAGIWFHPMDVNPAWTYNANGSIATTDDMGWPDQGWLDTSEDGSYSVITELCPTLTVGDLVWQDDDNDGIKDATESGVDGVALQLWTPGVNGTRENGGGDDQFVADTVSFNGGFYQFQDVLAGVYYVRIPNPPAGLPLASGTVTTTDNSVNNDNNGSQPGGSGTQIVSPLITLTVGAEPSGAGSNEDTIDFGLRPVATDFGDYLNFAAASQTANSALRIGTAATDTEASTPGNATASGDDLVGDDEDLTMPNFPAGTGSTLSIPVTVNTASLSGNTARLGVFVDWNGDNDVADANETLTAQTVNASGTYNFSLVPPFGTPAGNRFVRLRLTEGTTAPTFSGNSTLKGEVEDYQVIVATDDHGDYSLFGSAGSTVNSTLRLGALTEAEQVQVWNATATGDDTTDLDDEDGVSLPASMNAGTTAALTVTATNTTGSSAYLSVWVDYNRNGVLTDAGEQLSPGNTLIATGSVGVPRTYNIVLPANATTGSMGVRVRLTSTSAPGPTGDSGIGEVEDYVVAVNAVPIDYGDWNGAGAATTTTSNTVNSNLRLGALVDSESTVTPDAAATADDTTGSDDEDGIAFSVSSAPRGTTFTITATVSNSGYLNPRLAGWIDWNNDGDFADAGEDVVPVTSVGTGANQSFAFLVSVPNAAVIGTLGARFRLSTTTPTATGAQSEVGEIEDYTLNVTSMGSDFSDAPATYGTASHTVLAGIGLGCLVDLESAVFNTATANGDDANGVDDEDGVFFDTPFVIGATGHGVISMRGSGFLSMWIDWNRDGDFADAGEQILNNASRTAGSNGWVIPEVLNIPVPAGAVAGATIARVRYSSVTGTAATGSVDGGEVEDHPLTILPAATVSGRVWRDNNNGIRDAGEPGLEHFVVTLYRSDGRAEAMTVTNASGDYSFTSLAPRNYYVGIELPTSHTLGGMDLGGNDAVDSDFNTSTRVTATFTLASGATQANVDAGVNVPANTITYSVLRPLANTTWTQAFAMPQLAPAIGTPTAVQLRAFSLQHYDTLAENFAIGAQSVTFSEIPTFTVTLPNATTLVTTANSPLTFNHANRDLCIDYHGTSGTAGFDQNMLFRTVSSTYGTPATFAGTGTVSLSGATSVDGGISSTGGNYTFSTQLQMAGIVSVTYTYTPPTTDFGDWSHATNPSGAATTTTTSTINSTLRLGEFVDAEASVSPNAAATTDDTTNTGAADDEDGVTVPASITQGASATVTARVLNTSGANGFLHAWIDFNNDGVFNNTIYTTAGGERLEAVRTITTGTTTTTAQNITFTVPSNASPGTQRGVRVRFTNQNTTTPTGASGTGEIEDYVVTIACSAITVNPTSLANGTVGLAYSQTLTATGGTAPYTYALTTGTLPAGLTLNSAGVLSGTPTASNGAGTSLTFTATDSLGCTGTRTMTLKVCPVLSLSNLGGSAVVGRAFSQTVTASGGASAYTYAITSGSLPAGLSLAASTGIISGTPTTAGPSSFTITATDANGCPGSKSYVIQTHATLIEWNTEDSTNGGNVSMPSFVHACIFGTNGLNHSDNGTILATANSALNGITMTGARARSTTGWDNTDTFTLPRPDDGFNDRVLTSTFAFENLLTLNWGTFSMDVRRPATNSPTKFRAALIWFQGSYPYSSGIVPPASAVKTAWTGTFSVTSTNTWTTLNMGFVNFSSGVTALPAFNEVANEKMVLIVQAWDGASGGTVGALEYDNVVLGGSATCGPALSIGDTVFADLNGNSTYESATDSGINGLAVELLTAAGTSFTPPVTTTTNASGVYSFTGLPAGSYKVKVTPGTSYPLAVTAVNADNGVNNDSNGIQAAQGAAAISPVITLANNTEPGTAGGGNAETTIDFGFKTCPPITVNPTSLANGTVGTAYSQTISGTGGVGPYTFSVTSGTLPAGLSLNASSGLISGTPTSSTSQSFTIQITDLYGCTGTRSYTVTPVCPAITVNPLVLPAATVGVAYSQTLTATGGTAAYSFAVSAGTLPAGLTLSTAGVLSGTPTTANGAGVSVTIRATDTYGCAGTRVYALKVCPVVTVSPTSLANGTVGTAYSQTLSASGGVAAYTYAVTSGSLPTGLSLNTSTGVVSGTPTVAGSSTVTVTATDANGCPGSRAYTVTMSCPAITVNPTSLANGTISLAYPSTTFTATGGTGTYTYTVVAGSLPAGLTLTTAGVLSGTPTASNGAGVSITVQARDSNNCTGTRAYNLKICPVVTVNPTSLVNGTVGTAYSQTVSATGGATPYTFAVASGTLPAGLTLNTSTGVISGTPTSTTAQTFTLRATDVNGCAGTRAYTVTPVCPTITIAPTTLANATLGIAYSQTLTGSGGTSPYTWSVTSGTLPAGLTLNASTGVISGTPTASNGAGVSVTFRAQDAYGCAVTRAINVRVCPTITTTPTTLANGTVGTAYSQTFAASGGATPYTYAVATGTLPTGLSLNASTGVISGTPTSTAAQTFTLSATDVNTCVVTRSYTVTPACPAITVNPTTLTAPTTGVAYSATVSATGGTAPYTFAISAGSLPSGLSLNATTGVISGTTGSTAATSFTVRATDVYGCTGTRAYAVTPVCPTITVSPTSVPNAYVGIAYSQTFTAAGGTAGYTFNVSAGTLPAGLTLSAAGVLSGTPTTANGAGVSVTVRAVDANGCAGTRAVTIRVCPTINTTPTTLANGTVGLAYSQTFAASGGVTPYTYAVSSGTLPTGLSLNATTGAITGTPTSTTAQTFTLSATDANTCVGTRSYTVTPACPAITVNPTSLSNGVVGTAYSQTVSATGGTAPYTFALSTGTLPAGLTLNATTGVISGTPTSTTAQTFTMRATDTYGCTGTRAYTVTPACPAITVNPLVLPAATVGVAYSQTLTATGGTAAYSFAVSAGTLPAGLTLTTAGVLSGTPTTANGAGVSVTIRATDLYGCQGTRVYALKVCPVVTVSPTSLANGTVGTAYSQTLSASGGVAAYTYAVTSGSLPTGLSLNTSTGVVSGTPTVAGSSTVTVTATDANGCPGSRAYTLTMSCPTITVNPTSLANGTIGLAYPSTTFTATGGTGTYTYTVVAGSLPAGLTLTTAGVLSGTPTASNGAGVSITVQAKDVNNCTGTRAYNLKICPVVNLSPTTLATATVTQAYSQTIVASGGATPYTFAVSSGSLPAGLTLNTSTGVISGTPTALTSATFTIAATDANACTGSRAYTLTPVCPTITLSPATLPNGTVGTAYSQTLSATGGTGAKTFAVTTGTLPAGLTLSTAGVLSGTPTSIATQTFTVTATDTLGCTGALSYTMTPNPNTDWGDFSAFGTASNTLNSNLRLGALVDVEGVAPTDANATGDDLSGSDDEDGVTFPSMTAGQPVTVPVTVTNNTGTVAYLNVWMDFNDNGVLTDTGEQIANNVSIPNGSTNLVQNVSFTLPPSTVTTSTIGVRARLTFAATPGPTGSGSAGEVEDYAVTVLNPTTDFGDWSGAADAVNTANSNLRMGALVDAEYTATKNAAATGDDTTGNDDEDGVTIPSLTAGGPATIGVTVTNSTGANAYLNAWIDFNNNGSFADAGEQIFTNITITTGSANALQNLGVTVPPAAVTGTALGARFRLTSALSPGPTGIGGVGEVEDYVVTIAQPTTDFGDYASFASASSTRNANLRLGATIDTEFAATTNAAATGDDTTGTDDEDGVTLPSMTAGAPATIPLVVTNNTGALAYINAWIDYNGNNSIADAGEQIATNVSVVTGTTNGTLNLNVTVPPTALTGVSLGVRFRLTSTLSPGASGASGNGEVEDYKVIIAAPTTDFGDFSGFADASQGANASLYMGAGIDTEFAATKNATATGDDTTGTDDEDGATIPSVTAGQTVTVPVTVTNNTGANAYLNAWMDFNNNNNPADTGEQFGTNVSVPTGTTNGVVNLTLVVPANAVTGTNLGVRFRLSAPNGLGPTGANSLAGEVEDYVVNVLAPTTDFGDHSGYADASSTVISTIRLGATTDREFAATRNATATGDDITGTDDEDGVTIPSMTAGAPATIPVIVTNTTGVAVNLNAWIDYNNNGSFADAGEQIATNTGVATGTTNGTLNLGITVPATAVTGLPLGVRVRLTSTASPGPTGASGNGEVEDYIVTIASPTTDFGDWNRVADASNGASTSLRLGATVDTEFVSTRNATATGDDTTGSDDEDGVTFPSLIAGGTFTVPVTVTNITGAGAFLNVWIDFNNNGVLTDAGEQVAVNTAVTTGLTNSVLNLSVPVPVGAVTGTALGARFRLTSAATPGATGSGGGTGEVEDYVVTIAQPTTDFGDHSALGSTSSTVNSNLRLGALTDVEYLATLNSSGTGDDLTGSDDEDAVTLPSLTAGGPATIPVLVTNNTGAAAYLNAWIDYNGNGVLTDAGEQIATNTAVVTGTTNGTLNLNITVPITATQGAALPVRFRLTNNQNPGSTGLSGSGEVEDYTVTIATPPSDFGDFSGFTSAFSTRNAAIKIGATTDTEFAATSNALATGDDTTGSDDEDGVTVPSMTAGAPATLVVNVTNSSGAVAYLNAWIDFNNNGVLTDAGEQIASDTSIATGTNAVAQNIAFTVPAAAVTGTNIGIRVRLTSTITPGSTGGSGNGEVEDHIVNIAVPTTDFGDWNSAADASSIASNNLRMGPLVDTEFVSTRNGTATGDDTTASDDEDGVTLPTLTPGTSSNASVTVTNLSGAPAYLNAWVDFNNNGSFADAGEQVATNVSIATGTNATAQSVSIVTPVAAVPGQRGARFRFTSTQTPGATGASGTGEVEDYLVTVNCLPVTVNPTSVANGLVGTAYSQTLTGSGGMAPYSFAVTAGTLPAGLTLSTAGVISGTPTVSNGAGTSVTIRATDAYGCSGTRAYTIKICPVISLATLNSTLTIGSAYSSSAAASGGVSPYVYAVTTGTLPTGLTLNTTTGAVTGTPTVTTSQTFTITATDANACVGTRSYTLAPACPTITVTPTSPANAFLNTAYSQTFSASGGTSPYSYTVTSGTLPAGLTLSTAGVLSGTPTTAGTATVTIRATDNYGCTGSASVTITVRGLIIGDMIFNDANNNGLLDGGETGITGATVQLWNPGADNVIGGASADSQVGSNFTTTATGLYSFTNLPPGNYYVRVTLPAPFNMTGGTPATTDNNVNNNNDGSQPGGVGTPLFSPVINLAVGAESTTDGDADSSSNMTIDFGAYAGICVGNLVFKDVNNNGSYQAGTDTVLSGVQLRIFPSSVTDPLTGTPLYSTTSNASGIYQFCVPAGSYYIHVPPSQFATSAVLDNHIPAIGPTDNVVTPVDDNLDQNVLMAFKPSFTGVNTGIFTLALGAEPTNATGETGTSNTSDDTADSNTDLTVDLGFYPLPPPGTALGTSNTSSNNLSASGMSSSNLLAAPVTYASWLQSNAGEDDGDLYPKLLEYALGTDPASGASGAGAVRLETSTSHADFVFTRPAGGRADVRYELEASTDGQNWTRLSIVPTTSIGSDGRQIVRHASVDQAAFFAGSKRGLLRLKAGLDSNLDGTFEETAASPVLMFSRETFPAGVQRTFSMPLVQNELFAGLVSVSGDRITLPQAVKLPAGKQLYIEDLATGQAFEVDEAASSTTRLVLESAMTVRTARIALRAHHTLAALMPEKVFTADEDRVITFDTAANDFVVTTLADTGWQREGKSASADLVPPQAAMLVHARNSEVTLLFTGQVTNKPVMAASKVTRFIGSGSILPESPASLGLSSENGFRSSETATEAARLRFWKADADASQTGYENLYLAPGLWTRQNTLVTEDLTDAKLFQPFRAFFVLP